MGEENDLSHESRKCDTLDKSLVLNVSLEI